MRTNRLRLLESIDLNVLLIKYILLFKKQLLGGFESMTLEILIFGLT